MEKENELQGYVSHDETSRIIYMFGEINAASVGYAYSSIMTHILDDIDNDIVIENRRPIRLFINSHGGELCDMWALIDVMVNSKTPIETYCTGYAESAGFKIFLAGHKRFVSEHATLMYHQISSIEEGRFQDLMEKRKEFEWQQKAIEDYVLSRTENITRNMLNEVREKKKDWFIHADEAVKLGLADTMVY